MMNRRKLLSRFAGLLGLGFAASKASAKSQLSPIEIAKAWQEPSFRNGLSKAQWEALPPNPAGEIRGGEFNGNLQTAQSSGNNCSGNNCSGNSCSGNNCSGNNCSGNNCSGNRC